MGMRVMHGLVGRAAEALKPFAEKYNADVEVGWEVVRGLRKGLFPGVGDGEGVSGSGLFDCLLVLQGLYGFVAYVESHLVVLGPTSQASWDTGFVEAVTKVKGLVERVKAWTVQQLGARGAQVLLVPCEEASGLRERVERRGVGW